MSFPPTSPYKTKNAKNQRFSWRLFELLDTYEQVTTLQNNLNLSNKFFVMKMRNISMRLKWGSKSIWYEWLTKLKLASVCWRTFIATDSEQQQIHNHHNYNRVLHEKKTECSLNISWKNHSLMLSLFYSESSHTKIASNLIIIFWGKRS